jgi:hypothetical protein
MSDLDHQGYNQDYRVKEAEAKTFFNNQLKKWSKKNKYWGKLIIDNIGRTKIEKVWVFGEYQDLTVDDNNFKLKDPKDIHFLPDDRDEMGNHKAGDFAVFGLQIRFNRDHECYIAPINPRILSKEKFEEYDLRDLERKREEEERKLSSLNSDIEKAENKNKELTNTINVSKIKLEELEININDRKSIFKINLEKNEKLEKALQKFQKLGLIPCNSCERNNASSESKSSEAKKLSPKEIVEQVCRYIKLHDGIYTDDFIKIFTAMIFSNEMIVLAGQPGTGKTSFCRLFGDAVDASVHVIPVKPNWTSPDDLLGYVNPMDKTYVTTPFYKAVTEAKDDPKRLYIVVLDEMNLARPEYYLADLLSSLENRSAPASITLSNIDTDTKEQREQLRTFISSMFEAGLQDKGGLKKILEEERNRKFLAKSIKCSETEVEQKISACIFAETKEHSLPSEIKIPKNLRIVGTINIDETTNFFSPKVLDRVLVLNTPDPLDQVIQEAVPDSTNVVPISVSAEAFGKRTKYPIFDASNPLTKKLLEIKDLLQGLGIKLSMRMIRQAQNFAESAKTVGMNEEEIFSAVFQLKILPKFVMDADAYSSNSNKSKAEIINELADKLEPDLTAETKKSMEALKKQAAYGDKQVNYWEI